MRMLPVLVVLACVPRSVAQPCAPGWEAPWPSGAVDGPVHSLKVWAGALYAGGEFKRAGGVACGGLARWTGDHWEGLVPPPSAFQTQAPIRALEVFDQGSGEVLYAGGDQGAFHSTPGQNIVRLGPAGWEPVGSGLAGRVYALTTFDDGAGLALFAGGSFTGGVAKWDGASWTALGAGLSGVGPAGGPQGARDLAVFDDGRGPALFVGGNFTHAGGVARKAIARWDGSAWSDVGQGISGGQELVSSMTVEGLTGVARLVVAGRFTHAGPTAANNLAAWDGRAWAGFGLGGGGGINTVHAADDGTGPALYAGGSLSWGSGVAQTARWTPLAGWSKLDGDLSLTGNNPDEYCMVTFDGGTGPSVIIGGLFERAGPTASANLAVWKQGAWRGLGTGVNGPVQAIATFSKSPNTVYIGGRFGGFGDTHSPGVVGLQDSTPFALGTGVAGDVYALSEWDDGSGSALYAGGLFGAAGGVTARNVARWNGQAWSPLGPGIPAGVGRTGAVYALHPHNDGSSEQLYAAGNIEFSTGPGQYCYNIVRWDGAAWTGVASGLLSSNNGYSLAVLDSGGGPRLYAGSEYNSPTPRSFSRWDGAAWTQPLITEPPLSIFTLKVWNDGFSATALWAGGTAGNLFRIIGNSWIAVPGFSQGVSGIAVYTLEGADDGTGPALYVGGNFGVTGAGATPVPHANNIVRRRGITWEGLGSAPNRGTAGPVFALKSTREGDREVLWVGGDFSAAGGATAGRLARWAGCPICYADCNRDGRLTAADFGCFQSKFVAGDPYSDCNADKILTAADFGCFQTRFVAGCP